MSEFNYSTEVPDLIRAALEHLARGSLRLAEEHLSRVDEERLRVEWFLPWRKVPRVASQASERSHFTVPSTGIRMSRDEVFLRDGFMCRWCGRRAISTEVIKRLAGVFPNTLAWHPHWKFGESTMVLWLLGSSLDHVVPRTRGGDDAAENLVTACWRCNHMKGNRLASEMGWELSGETVGAWDGLTPFLSFL